MYQSNLGNKEIFAENLKRLIEQKGITINDLSVILDVPYGTVWNWTAAKAYPRIDKIEMMAKYFGVNKSDLVEKPEDVMEDKLEKAFRGRADMKKLFKLADKLDPKELYAIIKTLEALTGENGTDDN